MTRKRHSATRECSLAAGLSGLKSGMLVQRPSVCAHTSMIRAAKTHSERIATILQVGLSETSVTSMLRRGRKSSWSGRSDTRRRSQLWLCQLRCLMRWLTISDAAYSSSERMPKESRLRKKQLYLLRIQVSTPISAPDAYHLCSHKLPLGNSCVRLEAVRPDKKALFGETPNYLNMMDFI